jgi:uncharacterized protein YggE
MENTIQITVADLDAARGIIDLAVKRGAFGAAEVGQVGAVFNKLTAFLDSVVEQAKAAQEAQQAAVAETATDNTAETQGE